MTGDILLPVFLFAGLSLFAGILLALAAVFLRVSKDVRIDKIRDLLPGVNCGACGCGGCDDYAAKVVAGEECNLCTPGGASIAQQISEIMGVEAKETTRMIAFVNCNGTKGATSDKYEYSGVNSCVAAALMYGGQGKCSYSCLGYGDCVQKCSYDAIHVVDGVAVVDPCKCTGCMLCVTGCPKRIISSKPAEKLVAVVCSSKNNPKETRGVCSNGCIACRRCEKICPNDAVHIKDNVAVIDYDKCTDCGKCVEVCPVHCIFGVIAAED